MNNYSTGVITLRTFFCSIAMLFAVLAFAGLTIGKEEMSMTEATKFLSDSIENFHAKAPARALSDDVLGRSIEATDSISAAVRDYTDAGGLDITIAVFRTEKDSAAYALLTQLAPATESINTADVGIASVSLPDRILFSKGDTFVAIKAAAGALFPRDELRPLAKAFAATLPQGDDEIPVLVKHLPSGQTSKHCLYAVSSNGLKAIAPNQSILESVSFEGGTEAVAANYDQSQLVIIEFTTPQFAGDNDGAIAAKIQQLKSQGQAVPTAYRRVGNYSVFVFNAPDEKTANDLIDQVKYQKVVQWLGEDPHLYERLQKYFAQTSAGVLIAVLESSGLSLLICLGLGALFGTLLFRYRRAQRATRYSDAGGIVRLNLDELTAHGNSRRLLKSPGPRESPSKHS